MKTALVFVILAVALSFCGIIDRLTGRNSRFDSPANSGVSSSGEPAVSSKGETNIIFETPQPTAAQQAIIDGGREFSWDAQGLKWKLPPNWKKGNEDRYFITFMSPDFAVLSANISPLQNDFPIDISLKATYDGDITRMKNGDLETVRYLEIDGVKGVESIETSQGKGSPRRHLWIAYRKYAGQLQMLNFILSGNFDKHRDDLAAILYSTKIIK
jgi:hypothetical protein